MLPPELWLHIAIGFFLGALSAGFATGVLSQLKKDKSIPSLFKRLFLYSFLVTCIFVFYQFAISDGVLEQWQLLGYPATNDPAVKILDVGYVQGESGNIYYDNEGNWERVDKVVIDPEKSFIPIDTYSSNCGSFPFYPFITRELGFIEVKSTCMLWRGLEKVVYAIDYIGRVYLWSHRVPPEFNGSEIIYGFQGGLLSCVFGLIIVGTIFLFNFLTGKMKKTFEEKGIGK